MRRVIWKYPIEQNKVDLTVGTLPIVRHVGEQHGRLTVWVEHSVDDGMQLPARPSMLRLRIVPTGGEAPARESHMFLGTVQMSSGLVWHVYAEVSV